MHPMPVMVAVVSLAACAGKAVAERTPIEVSEDGRLTASPEPPGPGAVLRADAPEGDSVPYGATPDWQLDLRRQVGVVRIGDLNGDGKNDLFVGCYISQSFPPYTDWEDMIFYNTGSTLQATPGWISADEVHTGDAQLGDINGDSRLDVFAVSGGTAFTPPRIYFGIGGGVSTTAGWISTPPMSGWATSATLFDADDDGDLDVVTTNQGIDPNPFRPMYFFRNNAGALGTSPVWSSAESSIQNTTAVADYDGDKDPDIAVAKWANWVSGVYEITGGTPDAAPTWTSGTGTNRGVAWADVDGNGWPDLVIGGSGSTNLTKLYSNTAGVLTHTWTATPAFTGPQENTFEDVDQDGDPDFAEVHFSNGQTHIYLNVGGTLSTTPNWTYDATQVGNALAFGDINGDGWKDLAIGYSGDTCVRVFFAVPPPPPPCPADLDGSGTIDSTDLNILLTDFGCVGAGCVGDVDGDNDTDSTDLNIVLTVFGTDCP